MKGTAKPAGPPRVILCAGTKSSGSTWLFNVVIQVLREHVRRARKPARIAAFYADNFRMFPRGAERASHLVIKTHEPSESLLFLTRFLRGKVLLTVREPRDAVASLLLRFRHAFEPTLTDLERQAGRIATLARTPGTPVLRYEDGFFDNPKSVERIARMLGVRLTAQAAARIFSSLTRQAVAGRIERLRKSGRFGKSPSADSFDPATHWHPGHVGDASVGKYESVLSRAQQRRVLAATRSYCRDFGYAGERRPAGKARR